MSLSNSAIALGLSLTRKALTNLFNAPENIARLQNVFGKFDLDAAWLWLEREIHHNFSLTSRSPAP